jgi:hypothetical protein
MWWVESNAAQAHASSSLEEALALCAHLMLRGFQVTCIRRGGIVVMDRVQIRYALENLDNVPPTTNFSGPESSLQLLAFL